jgi:DNA-directed RNA polymerase sigma subunit (sigma70/sigma32)
LSLANYRLAVLVTVYFAEENGHRIDLDPPEAVRKLVGDVVDGDADVAVVRVWVQERLGPGDTRPPVEAAPEPITLPTADELVRTYLAEVDRHPLVTAEEETELAEQVEAGREARLRLDQGEVSDALQDAADRADRAERQLVQSHLRLVVSIARRYEAAGLSLLDLIQEGNVGLLHAVAKFDWRKGFKFSTYATWWIRQAITRAIADRSRRTPEGKISMPVGPGADRPLKIDDLLSGLTAEERAIVRLRFGLDRTQPRTLEETSAEIELPIDRVRELEQAALAKIRRRV